MSSETRIQVCAEFDGKCSRALDQQQARQQELGPNLRPLLLGAFCLCLACQTPTPQLPPAGSVDVQVPPPPLDANLSATQAREDLRQLVELMEQTHPDPFLYAGGRVAYFRKLDAALRSIPSTGLTVLELLAIARPLVAAVRDGHTSIRSTWLPLHPSCLNIEWEVIETSLVVVATGEGVDHSLLGARLASIEGVPYAELVERMKSLRGFDNRSQNLVHLAEAICDPFLLVELLAASELPETVAAELEKGDRTETLALQFGERDDTALQRAPASLSLPQPDSSDIAWGFADEQHQVAYLRIDSMMRYREAFELWNSVGFTSNLGSWLDEQVEEAAPTANPSTIEEKIALLPSACEHFEALTDAIAAHQSRYLIVDLRRNGGGNSAISAMLLFAIFGRNALLESDGGYQVPRYSSLYLSKYRNRQLEELGDGELLEGDYDFSAEREWQALQAGDSRGFAVRRQEALEQLLAATPSFAAAVARKKQPPPPPPTIIVLSSARTYSAGFDMLTELYRRGAVVVGVPSAQAGNCFIDALPYRLDNSGLTGTISYKRSLSFPDRPELGELLVPELELRYEDYVASGFSPHATVQLALRWIENTKLAGTSPEL